MTKSKKDTQSSWVMNMKRINWNYIKMVVVIALIGFLYGFAEKRNNYREINGVEVNFIEDENLYVTKDIVNKLLIQNKDKVKNATKETIALNEIEKRLDSHDMIADADVYVTVKGTLGATVVQRKPLGRVYGSTVFYIDSDGKKMPLSKHHSARVPLVFNVTDKDVLTVFPLLEFAASDSFLRKHITEIYKERNGTYTLKLRDVNFEVEFGLVNDIQRKINNLKAFYKKAMKDNKLNSYSKVNLQFGNQVVCTKKQ